MSLPGPRTRCALLVSTMAAASCSHRQPDDQTRQVAALEVSGFGRATVVSAQGDNSCARLATGRVVCWGVGEDGQLGSGRSLDSAVPVFVVGLSDAVSVSVGRRHACALRATRRRPAADAALITASGSTR